MSGNVSKFFDIFSEKTPLFNCRVTDSGGDSKVVMSKVANAPLEQKMLDTKVHGTFALYLAE